MKSPTFDLTYEVSSLEEVAHHFDRMAKECRDRVKPITRESLPVDDESRLLARQATTWQAAAAFIRRVKIVPSLPAGWVNDPKPGYEFRHAYLTDSHKRPLRFKITAVRNGLVYFSPVNAPEPKFATRCLAQKSFPDYVYPEDRK